MVYRGVTSIVPWCYETWGSRGSYADFGTELVSDPYQVTKLATIFRNQSFSNNLVWNWTESEILAKRNDGVFNTFLTMPGIQL